MNENKTNAPIKLPVRVVNNWLQDCNGKTIADLSDHNTKEVNEQIVAALNAPLEFADNITANKEAYRQGLVDGKREADALRAENERLTARLAMATTFELVPNRHWSLGESNQRPVVIEQRPQREGATKWVVKMHEWVLAKDGEFIWEPRPSERSDEFIALTRFDSVDEALEAYAAIKPKDAETSGEGTE